MEKMTNGLECDDAADEGVKGLFGYVCHLCNAIIVRKKHWAESVSSHIPRH
jgi:hypothetical protein